MLATLQRLLARTAAVAAIVFGAAVAIVLAVVTLLAGLTIGVIVAAAAWLGLRARRGIPGADERPGRDPSNEDTIIDVEMRELGRDDPADRREPPSP